LKDTTRKKHMLPHTIQRRLFKYSKVKMVLFLAVLPLLLATTCKEDPAGPGDGDNGYLPPLDTTSHDFTWQTWTFGGEFDYSVLKDVAIINDTCIWAVGELYLKDSLGNNDIYRYNAALWDGNKWTIKRISTWFRGYFITEALESIFAFSGNDIWCSGGWPVHGDGKTWTLYQLLEMGIIGPNDGSVDRMWGGSSNDMYFVGDKGTIVRYEGNNFQKLPTITNLRVMDIWGGKNPVTGEMEILAVASNTDTLVQLLQLQENTVRAIPGVGLRYRLSGIWFDPGRTYRLVGGGDYSKASFKSSDPWIEKNVTPYYTTAVRGNNANDIFIVGGGGAVVHFNGSTWRNYPELAMNGLFSSIAIKKDLVALVGRIGNSAIIVMGRRK
jgi:hypothetical protein